MDTKNTIKNTSIRERVSCNLCEKDNTSKFLVKSGYQIVSCKNCGLLYVNPRNPANSLEQLYNKNYFLHERFIASFQKKYSQIGPKDMYQIYFKEKIEKLHILKPEGKILDIGCALGNFLRNAKKIGYEIWGNDISPYSVNQAQAILKTKNIFPGDFLHLNLPNQKFDIITIFHTLEHTRNPLAVLKKIYTLLKPNGIVHIVIPNQESLLARLLKGKWSSYNPSEHLYYFNSNTLRLMLEKAGFQKIEISSDISKHYPLAYITARLYDLYIKKSTILLKISNIFFKTPLGSITIPIPSEDLSATAFKS